MKQQIYNTGIYLRLSCDDDVHGESVSISNQRQMLTQYCREHGLRIVDEYVDDGYSGTNFDRPGFQRMLDDIEDGKRSIFHPKVSAISQSATAWIAKRVKVRSHRF